MRRWWLTLIGAAIAAVSCSNGMQNGPAEVSETQPPPEAADIGSGGATDERIVELDRQYRSYLAHDLVLRQGREPARTVDLVCGGPADEISDCADGVRVGDVYYVTWGPLSGLESLTTGAEIVRDGYGLIEVIEGLRREPRA